MASLWAVSIGSGSGRINEEGFISYRFYPMAGKLARIGCLMMKNNKSSKPLHSSAIFRKPVDDAQYSAGVFVLLPVMFEIQFEHLRADPARNVESNDDRPTDDEGRRKSPRRQQRCSSSSAALRSCRDSRASSTLGLYSSLSRWFPPKGPSYTLLASY